MTSKRYSATVLFVEECAVNGIAKYARHWRSHKLACLTAVTAAVTGFVAAGAVATATAPTQLDTNGAVGTLVTTADGALSALSEVRAPSQPLVEHTFLTTDIPLDYVTEYIDNPAALEGTEELYQEGQSGFIREVTLVSTLHGAEIARETHLTIEVAARPQIVSRGTARSTIPTAPIPTAAGPAANRELGQQLAADRGWTGCEWNCLDNLFHRESNWRHDVGNPNSSAFGIPQAMGFWHPETRSEEWRSSPYLQIQWGLNYIARRYGTPCAAWAHFQRHGWY